MMRQEFQELAELYALGTLEAEEKTACDEFAASQPEEARAILRQAIVRNTYVLRSVEEAAPPARLRKNVVIALTGKPPKSYWSAIWAAATAVLAIGMFWLGRQNSAQEDQLAQVNRLLEQQSADARRSAAVLAMLTGPGTRTAAAGQGQASYFLNPQQGVVLIAGSLTPLQPGRTYQMWIIPKGRAPVPAGLFKPDAQGNAIHTFQTQVDIGDTGAMAVSNEPEAGSGAPTTTPILVAPVAGP